MTSVFVATSLIVMTISLACVPVTSAFAEPQDATDLCSAIAASSIPASRISLPTTGAKVQSATLIGGSDPANQKGEYCKVIGQIKPVDPKAPDITWQVNLPSAWNGKLLQYGGGGYNGSIPPTTDKTTLGLDVVPTPLEQGYVTFAAIPAIKLRTRTTPLSQKMMRRC